jgi:hypothetical protein
LFLLKRKTKYFKYFTDDRKGDDEESEESELDEDEEREDTISLVYKLYIFISNICDDIMFVLFNMSFVPFIYLS